MLPELNLNDEKFKQIAEEARDMIVSLFPEWTDFNFHDPGITMIEMFSWVKEYQQRYLNEISEETKQNFLKLLGVSCEHKKSAKGFLQITSDDEFVLAAGAKFYAGSICFEITKSYMVTNKEIETCFSAKDMIQDSVALKHLEQNQNINMFLFGKEPCKDSGFYIAFKEPLPQKQWISIFFDVMNEYKVKRNDINGSRFYPLAKLRFQYSTEEGFRDFDRYNDDTKNMLFDGTLRFCLDAPMRPIDIYGQNYCYIRVLVEECNYDISPVLRGIHMNVLPVEQRNTIIRSEQPKIYYNERTELFQFELSSNVGEEVTHKLFMNQQGVYYNLHSYAEYTYDFENKTAISFGTEEREFQHIKVVSYPVEWEKKLKLGEGNGLPFQEIELDEKGIVYDLFEIMIHEIGTESGYCIWEKVNDFSASKPEDKHYILDLKTGTVRFGNCRKGMAPEGEILLTSYTTTLGKEGNVTSGKINKGAGMENVKIRNIFDCKGGTDEEEIEDCFLRARQKIKNTITAVTYEDYENYIKQTPGLLIESCKVIAYKELKKLVKHADENMIGVVVKPYSNKGKNELSAIYKKNIKEHMEQYRMLGTELMILAPKYIKLKIHMELVVRPQYKDAQMRIQTAVEEYFSVKEEQFGGTIIHSELYGVIDMLECVSGITAIGIDVGDREAVTFQDENIYLPPDGVVEIEEILYSLTAEE